MWKRVKKNEGNLAGKAMSFASRRIIVKVRTLMWNSSKHVEIGVNLDLTKI